ncbi:MAG: tetratricopeptide repeat protein, partial [Chloroflexota bacterium]
SRRFHAATVFADISGFTPLAESLASSGVRGAEELTSILNRVFEDLITAAETHGGQVVKFGGDALSLIWACEQDRLEQGVWQAVQAAFAMQAAMASFATVSTSQGEFELRMKIGVSAGELLEVHAGGEFSRWEYVLAGAPMANMSSAENEAEAGEIVIDETAWLLLNGQDISEFENNADIVTSSTESYVFGEETAPGFYKVTHIWSKKPSIPLKSLDWSRLDSVAATKVATILRGYIPGAISSSLESGHKGMLAELKPMTVCFVGFSGIDYTNDDDAGSRLNNFMSDTQKMIYHYEGSVNKLAIGDKGSVMLVLFGAPPFFHEDDEVRGVACAMALGKVAARHKMELRVGLAAGPLFAGPLGAPQRREYSVIGDTVNLAARLMQKASTGEVYIDESVYSKTERFFEYQDLGEVAIKGKTEPRHLYLALHEKEQDQEELVKGYLLSNQELTGRDKELAIIDDLADKVWAGKGQVLLLSGEAGVGKSRLAAEIVRRWITRGGASYGGDCVSYGGQTPYLPWRGILSSIGGLSPRLPVKERLARLEHLLHRLPSKKSHAETASTELNTANGEDDSGDYWLERLPLLAEILGLEAPETNLTRNLSETLRRDNVFATIRAIVLQEIQQRPGLILIEDTHWSDELSLELATYLAADVNDHPLFLVLAHRPLGHPIPVEYQKLQAKSYTTQMLVDELGPEASLKLVKSKLGVKTLPDQLADLIYRKGQGNPFFIEELVNSLLGMNVLVIEDGECKIEGDLNQLELPDTVQKVVLARIDRLTEAVKVTLKVAAAIGRTFQRDLLEAIHPWITNETELNEQLALLQAADFTRQEVKESDLDFLFKHVITQEVAYETMLYSQRQQLHSTIGTVLETRYQNNEGEVIDLLAYHYSRGDNRQKALYYLHRAGEKALIGHANEAAISYFNEALSVAEELNDVKVQYDLSAGRERAYDRVGNRTAQTQDLKIMKKLALSENHIGRLLETGNRQLHLAADLGQYHEAIEISEEMLNLAKAHDQPEWEARILINLGITDWRQGEYEKAREFMQQALTRHKGVNGDRELRATCLNYLGLIHTRISEYQQARQDYQEALDLFRAINDRGGEAGSANNLGLLESSLGRYEQARDCYGQALSICHTIGDKLREGISLNTLGQVETLLGNYDRAEELLHRSLTIRREIVDRRGQAFCLHDLGYLYLAQADYEQAIEQFKAAAKLRHKLGETGNYVASLAALGEAVLGTGDTQKAYQHLQDVIDQVNDGSGTGEYPPQNIWWTYTRICKTLQGQETEAEQALQKAVQLVQAKADHINDESLKRSYLQNIQINAAIMAEVHNSNGVSNQP